MQVESPQAVENAAEMAAVEGVDGVFMGPSDLAATMGLLGQQNHPDVKAAVHRTIEAVKSTGKKVGVNAFDPAVAAEYREAGDDFLLLAPTWCCWPAAARVLPPASACPAELRSNHGLNPPRWLSLPTVAEPVEASQRAATAGFTLRASRNWFMVRSLWSRAASSTSRAGAPLAINCRMFSCSSTEVSERSGT